MDIKTLGKIAAALTLITVSGAVNAEPEKKPKLLPIKTTPTYYDSIPEIDTKLKIVHRQKAPSADDAVITPDPSPPGGLDNPDVRPVSPVNGKPQNIAGRKTGKGVVRDSPPPHVPVENNDANQRRGPAGGPKGGPVTTEPVVPPIVEPIRKPAIDPR